MLLPFETSSATDIIKDKYIYNWFSGLKVSCSLFVIEEKKLGGLFLVESFKREIKYKSLHISVVILSSCSILSLQYTGSAKAWRVISAISPGQGTVSVPLVGTKKRNVHHLHGCWEQSSV